MFLLFNRPTMQQRWLVARVLPSLLARRSATSSLVPLHWLNFSFVAPRRQVRAFGTSSTSTGGGSAGSSSRVDDDDYNQPVRADDPVADDTRTKILTTVRASHVQARPIARSSTVAASRHCCRRLAPSWAQDDVTLLCSNDGIFSL